MISRKMSQSGFTIVELLIVIVVIGILAGLVLNTFNGIQARARDTERRTDVNAIHAQLEAYHADNGYYPTDTQIVGGELVNAATAAQYDAATTADGTATTLFTGLDGEAVADPSAGGYYYNTTVDACDNTGTNLCTGYILMADLETDTEGKTETPAAGTTANDYSKNSLN